LVEGQIDLVMLHQVGITNTVASSGTALTQNHLVKLQRLSNRILMAYDGDTAGFSASNRSAQIALSLGMELKVAQMPIGKDPADLAKEDVEKLKEVFKSSKHIIDFYTDSLLERKLEARALGQEISKNVLPYVARLPSSIEQSHFVKNIAQKTFIKEEAIWDDLKKINTGGGQIITPRPASPPTGRRGPGIERRLLGIIIWQKEKRERNKEEGEVVDIDEIDKKVKEVLGQRYEDLTKILQKEKDLLMFETESYYGGKDNLKRDIEELLIGLEEENLKEEFGRAMISLQQAEQLKNSSEVLKYLEECQRISQKINTIKTIKNAYEKA
jgi:DNA primase